MTKINYGIDAPNLFKTFVLISASSIALIVLLRALLDDSFIRLIANIVLSAIAIYTGFMGTLMYCYSKYFKIQDAKNLLDTVAWTGDEEVLDIGCGRGLYLIQAAKRLTTGKVTGIDIWLAEDQSSNTQEQTFQNLKLADVADKAEIQTADMTKLPFQDERFNIVTSGWAIHNVETLEDRSQAIAEIVRVLSPGGTLLIADITNKDEYFDLFKMYGLVDIKIQSNNLKESLLRAVSFGGFGPFSISAKKPNH